MKKYLASAFLAVQVVMVGGFLFLPQASVAAINEQIPFYGTLKDTSGTSLSGTYDMTFRFYDSASGGTLLDTSTHTAANGNAVTVTNGEFSALLGSGTGNALNGLDFNTASIYVGITIGTDSEMTPRERLGSAAYSFNTDTLDGYDSLDLLRLNATNTIQASAATPLLSIIQNGIGDILNIFDGGTEVFTILDGGSVGVGTSSPMSRFTVAGDARITGALRDSSGDAGTNGMVLLSTGSGMNWVATSSLGISGGGGSLFTDGGATTYLTATGDNLAIGTTTASAKLTLAGNINIVGDYGLSVNGVRQFYASTTNDNLGIGRLAGANLLPDDVYNIAIGYQAAANSTTSPYYVSWSTFIGYQAGYNTSESNAVMIGTGAGYESSGDSNVSVGYEAGYQSNGYNNNFFGYRAGYSNDGSSNIGIGESVAQYISGDYNIALGVAAGYLNAGDSNVLVGDSSGYQNEGNQNILLGVSAGLGNLGDNNILMGYQSGYQNEGDMNVMLGYEAGRNLNATSSIIIGPYAARGNAGISQRDSINNLVIGYRSGYLMSDNANNNVYLGYQVADETLTGTNNIVLGYNIDVVPVTGTALAQTASNRLNIGNLIFGTGVDGTGTTLSSGNIGIGTSTPSQKLQVQGNLRVTGAYFDTSGDAGTSGQVLLSTLTGTNWTSTSSLGITASLGNNSVTPNNLLTTGQTDEYCLTYETTGSTWEWQTCGAGGSLFTDGGATTYLTSLTDNLAVGSTTASEKLFVAGNLRLDGSYVMFSDYSFGSNQYLYASTSNWTYAIGDNAAASSTSYSSFLVGYHTGMNSAAGNLIAIGDEAAFESTGTENTALGRYAGYSNTGNDNFFFGNSAGYENTGTGNFIVGKSAGLLNSGNSNLIIGEEAGYNTNSSYNILLGNFAGSAAATGNWNIMIGEQTGRYATNVYSNVFVGAFTGSQARGLENTFVGNASGGLSTGNYNEYFGAVTGTYNRGSYNQFIGYFAGTYLNSTSSVAIGTEALMGNNVSGPERRYAAINNVALGYRAGYNATNTASNNILLGYQAADNLTTGNNNIIIGYDIDNITATADNRLNIGNLIFGTGLDGTGTTLASGNVGIGTSSPSSKFTVAGDARITGAFRDTSGDAGTAGQVLLSTLTGTNWTSTSSLGITASLGNNSVTPNNLLTTGQTDEYCLTYETTGSTWEWQTCGAGGSLFTDGGATTYLTATGDNLAIGSTTASEKLFVAGNISMDGAYVKFSDYAYGSNQYFFASTSAWTYAIGDTAGASNSGFDNFFVGVQAGELNAGDNNNLLGDYSGRSNTGSFNFFVGYQTGQFNTGDANVLLGYNSGRNNTGNENFFAGSGAGENNTANYSTFIGNSAGALNIGDYNNYIGYLAGSNASTSNSYWNNYIGHSAGANSDGHINNFMGYLTGQNSSGSFNTFLGNQVGTNSSGEGNIFVGESIGYQNTGNSNSALGQYAAYQNSGGSNTMLGSYSGYGNSGSTNDLIGYYAGYGNSGNRNFISGSLAGYANQGDDNIFIGWNAGYVNRGDYNQLLGSGAGHYLNGTSSVAVGSFALRGGLTSSYAAVNNTAVGYRSGYNIRAGSDNNIFLGYQAGDNITTGDNNIIIGYDVDHISAALSNRLNIGNLIFGTGIDGTGTTLSSGNIGIGTSSPASKLSVAGDLRVTGALRDTSGDAGTAGQVLLSTLTGTNWTSTSSLGITATLGNNSVTPNNLLTTGQTDEYCLTYETTGSTWEWQTCGGGGSLFTDGGATTYLTSLTDNLGVGTTTSTAKLSVHGELSISNLASGVSFGSERMIYASSTIESVAFGRFAGASWDGTEYGNVAIGYDAGRFSSTTNSFENTYIGIAAGRNDAGWDNTIVGAWAGNLNSGDENSIFGAYAAENNTGNQNLIAGYLTGSSNTGNFNNLLGVEAGLSNTGNFNDIIGYNAGANNSSYENVIIGYLAGENNADYQNILIGSNAGRNNLGPDNVMLGWSAGHDNTATSSVMIGHNTGFYNSGLRSTMLGYEAGFLNSGDYLAALGFFAGGNNSGDYNNFFGYTAGGLNTGDYNNFIGYEAGYDENEGDFNDFIGYQAGKYINSTSTVAIGGLAIRGGVTTAVNVLNTVALGYRAGYNIRSGADNNIFLGYQAGDNITTGDNNIIIGYDVDHISPALNNRLNIGNLIFGTGVDGTSATLSTGNIGISTSSPNQKLTIMRNTAASTNDAAIELSGASGSTYKWTVGMDHSDGGKFKIASSSVLGTNDRLVINGSGNVGIGTSTPLQKLQVRGDIRVGTTGSNGCLEDYGGGVIGGTCSSDERLKIEIKEISSEERSYLEGIVALKPVHYKWNEMASDLYKKDGDQLNLGLVAQNVEAVFPELVSRNSENYRQVDFRALPFYMIEAIKELWMKVTGLEEKVKEIDELERRIKKLEDAANISYTPPEPEPEVGSVVVDELSNPETTQTEPAEESSVVEEEVTDSSDAGGDEPVI